MGWDGPLELHVGRPARDGEAYAVFSDALAPDEPLACRSLLGRPAGAVASEIDATDLEVTFQPEARPPSGPLTAGQVRAGPFRSWTVTAIDAPDASRVLVRLGSPRRSPARSHDLAEVSCMTIVSPSPRVFIDLRDTSIRPALLHACEAAGWSRTAAPTARTALVADQLVTRAPRPLDVLVTDPTPASSRLALEAFTAGRALAIVASTEPHTLPRALELARAGYGIVPRVVVEAAERLPEIPVRLQQVLQLVLRGRTNVVISRALGQSLSSTKRDMTMLLHLFDAANRQALIAAAMRMGIRPGGGLP